MKRGRALLWNRGNDKEGALPFWRKAFKITYEFSDDFLVDRVQIPSGLGKEDRFSFP